MIAMALMCGPDLIIADEPTTALDVTIQAQILHLLAELQADFEMAMILITHDLGIVARVADKVQVMYAGRTVEEGPCEAVFDTPLHPYTAGLLRCIPVPGKTSAGATAGHGAGDCAEYGGRLRGCMFRNRCENWPPKHAKPCPTRRLSSTTAMPSLAASRRTRRPGSRGNDVNAPAALEVVDVSACFASIRDSSKAPNRYGRSTGSR